MNAAVEAQAMAAQTSIDFIRSIGFTSDSEDEQFGDVRMVVFTYKSRNNEGELDEITLTVPILTIVPIPYLRIEDMTIDFTSKITEEMVRTTKRDTSVEAKAELSVGYKQFLSPVKVNFKASVSAKHSSSKATSNRYKTEHTININVRAVQDDIPGGMGRILDLFETAITEQAAPANP
ncbi:DUF2589 domain-containing protein [Paraneptunicella aestuarii]|uniref:DUF2589 domain-containing protein n=1 Tax=Paraneptunicella aestuarii TaxID=2831148 RepID=UPI001E346C5F|nr:DUF2589 domain-containing protein [Paraneptunicella aestuarii]UAA37537.1 DUF2589 domain-containing protein [Paraneptunicella aestuarii]